MMIRRLFLVALVLILPTLCSNAQAVPAEKADDARIERLLKQMTLEEKMNLIRGDVEPAATNRQSCAHTTSSTVRLRVATRIR
jgi:beta-glucosidase